MPKGLSHKEHVDAHLRVGNALTDLRHAVDEGDLKSASRRLGEVERAHEEHAPDLSVAEAAQRLGVTPPTIAAWGRKGLLELLDTKPRTVSLRSVLELEGKLHRLRAVAKDKRKWAALLERVRDQEELDLPGARQGLREALAQRERGERGAKSGRRAASVA